VPVLFDARDVVVVSESFVTDVLTLSALVVAPNVYREVPAVGGYLVVTPVGLESTSFPLSSRKMPAPLLQQSLVSSQHRLPSGQIDTRGKCDPSSTQTQRHHD
jgi:hypothetical protein